MSTPDILQTLQTHLSDRYEVRTAAGEGGMATVFRAHDRKHGRDVAIKVLKAELAASIGRDRFLQEITIAARLQHPNILPVYDSGEVEGILYYVMPFIEGESLKERIERGEVPVAEALRIVREVAGALDYAHSENVVHRDIKPANILLSQGHAVVADFGIARAAAAPDQTQTPGITQVGTSVGTPWYMSPEQATADPNVDGRSDIYSLGCVLFELLEGRPPFEGDSVQTIIAKTISAPPPELQRSGQHLAAPVQAALKKALEKNPADRFATAGEFERALEAIGGGTPASSNRLVAIGVAVAVLIAFVGGMLLTSGGDTNVMSEAEVMAVLPFEVSGASDELGEGMVNLLATNLNAIGQLRMVDSRTVLQQWRARGGERGLDLENSLAVGRDVGAGSVLLGNIVALGDDIRITVDLYAVDGEQLANVQIDGDANNALLLVDSLSLGILQEIWRSNAPLPSFDVSAITSSSIDAIRAYMRGSLHLRTGTWDSARAAFQEAVDADSTFALAHFALSEAYGWTGQHGSQLQRETIARAVAHSDRLPPRERLLVKGYELNRNGDVTSIDTLERYTQLYPSDPRGWYGLGDFRFHDLGRLALSPEEQFEAFDKAVALDSSYTAALVHPMEIALLHGDEERFRTYAALTAAAGGDDRGYNSIAQFIWGNADERQQAIESLVRTNVLNMAVGAALMANPAAIDQAIAVSLEQLSTLPPNQAINVQFGISQVALSAGRLEVFNDIIDQFANHPSPNLHSLAAVLRILGAQAGVQAPATGQPGVDWFNENQPGAGGDFVTAIFSLATGDQQTAADHIARLDTVPRTNEGSNARIDALRGYQSLVAGDTAAALPILREALARVPSPNLGGNQIINVIKFEYARALAARPETYDEGIRLLEWGMVVQSAPEFLPARYLALADAYENAGDLNRAMDALTRFIELWDGASDVLQPRVQYARDRLAALEARNR